MKALYRRRISAHVHRPAPSGNPPTAPRRGRSLLIAAALLAVAAAVAAGYLARDLWLPQARLWMASLGQSAGATAEEHDHDHAAAEQGQAAPASGGHVHSAADAEHDAESLYLSEAGQKNAGLELVTIELGGFDRVIRVPATVTERPGRTQIEVSAPMTGIVTRIHAIRGEAVSPGQPLFDLRLTHEDLVEAQGRLLETAEELDVIQREVRRLEQVTASGAIAGKQVLERQYEEQKTAAALRAQKQALILHGLGEEQVEAIVRDRRLLQEVTVVCPQPADKSGENLLIVSSLDARQGQHAPAGQRLAVLNDHAELFIEGKAFEQDATALHEAAAEGRRLTAVVEAGGRGPHEISALTILYVDNEIEIDSRALRFYVGLPNELVRDDRDAEGRRFVGWRYKAGQRVELLVPVERWNDRIVLPVDAVIREGAEWFVFRRHGDHFDRRFVQLEFRDQRSAVIARDGALFPGDVVVAKGAYQLHLAMKNKSAGADPHAGHNH